MEFTGDEFEKLYSSLERPLYNFALRWTWNPASAQDLVQEAFIRLWNHDRIDRSTVKAFLYKIVRNLAINERRKFRLREAIPLMDLFVDRPTIDEEFIRREQLHAVHAAIESLPEEMRQTFLMCQYSDLTYDEIGAILGVPSGTVASRKNRALEILKKALLEPEVK